FYYEGGVEPMAPSQFVQGFVHYFASALLAGAILALMAKSRPTYLGRVGLVFLVGLFATVSIQLSAPIWFYHPWNYHLLTSLYDVVGGLLIGLVQGAVVRVKA